MSGASMPVIVIAGCDQIRERIVPSPDGRDAVEQTGLGTQLRLVVVGRLEARRGEALDRDRAVGVPQRVEQPDGREHRIGHRSPEHARVRSVGEGVDAQVERDRAAECHRDRRRLEVPVRRVRDDDRVGGEQFAVLTQEVRERLRQVLLLALDEQRDAEVEVGSEHLGQRPDGTDVRHDAGLVVGGAATVEPVASLRRLERRRIPVLLAAGRLHVVVGVQQHGRAAVAGRAVRDDRGKPQLRVIRSASEPATGARRTSTRSNTPSPRTSSATASADRCTFAGSNAGQETEGIFTRRARSAMVDGNPDSTAARNASMRRFASSDRDSVRRGSVMPVILRGTDSRNPVAKQPDSTDQPSAESLEETQARLKDGTRVPPPRAVQRRRRPASVRSCLTTARKRRSRLVPRPPSRARRLASAWPWATSGTCPCATAGRRRSTCATTSTPDSASARS